MRFAKKEKKITSIKAQEISFSSLTQVYFVINSNNKKN